LECARPCSSPHMAPETLGMQQFECWRPCSSRARAGSCSYSRLPLASAKFGMSTNLLALTALGLVALHFAPSHISDLHNILHILLPCATYITCTPLTSVTRQSSCILRPSRPHIPSAALLIYLSLFTPYGSATQFCSRQEEQAATRNRFSARHPHREAR
jgi:hypothetical protein